MSSGNLLWIGYSAAIRMVRRNALMYSLARMVPATLRVRTRRVLEGGLQRLLPIDTRKIYDVFGHRMYLDHASINQEYVTGTYEPDVRKVFTKYVKSGMTVVDVGAHIGIYTVTAARLVGESGKVFAFEPHPDLRATLENNITLNGYTGRCRILPYAVSDRSGAAGFFANPQESNQSRLVASTVDTATLTVDTVALDEFFSMEGWPGVDFVKMDIEGAERCALEGMAKLSGRNPRLKLVIEFGQELARRWGYGGQDLAETLMKLGFRTAYGIETGMKRFRLRDGWPATIYDNYLVTKEEV